MKKMLAILFCFILVFTCAAAHPGRTDANGGHWDHSTGEYHYHHGYEAHQHPDGVCPYDYNDLTGSTSGSSSGSSSSGGSILTVSDPYANERGDYGPEAESDFETKRDAHISGFESGIEYSFNSDNPDSAFSEGYAEGYEQGYSDSESISYDDGHQAGYDEGYDYGYKEGYSQGEVDTYESAENAGFQRGIDETESTYLGAIIIVGIIAACLLISRIRIGRTYDDLLRKVNSFGSKYQKFYSDHLRYVENSKAELNRLQSAISERDAIIRRLQTATPLINTAPSNPPFSFGLWPSTVHQTEEQFKRYQRSKSNNLQILTQSDDGYVIQGTSDVYITTLDSCTCPDFNQNLHGQAPCKHIYYLARKQGFDVDSIFRDFPQNLN